MEYSEPFGSVVFGWVFIPVLVGWVLRCTHPNLVSHTRRPNLSLLYICDLYSQPNRLLRENLENFTTLLNPVSDPDPVGSVSQPNRLLRENLENFKNLFSPVRTVCL